MEKKTYTNNNIKLGGVWEYGTKGHLRSVILNEETEKKLNNVVFEVGGRFIVTYTKPESKQLNSRLPEAFIEYQPKAEVEAEKIRMEQWKAKKYGGNQSQSTDSL